MIMYIINYFNIKQVVKSECYMKYKKMSLLLTRNNHSELKKSKFKTKKGIKSVLVCCLGPEGVQWKDYSDLVKCVPLCWASQVAQ